MTKSARRNGLYSLGAAYYPDYLPSSGPARRADGTIAVLTAAERMKEDFRRMRKAGLDVIRMGEFSWASVEPRRGAFQGERFDAALDLAAEHRIEVIFCTPTATPPKWLIDAHPDILPHTRTGARVPFGSRRHYDVHNPTFRHESVRITQSYAERWGRHPAVVGWQTDNEFGCHGSVFLFSQAARDAFRAWLKERYFGNIENLNAHWFTCFWSQRYGDFGQIELPYAAWADQNPGLELDFRRFSNEAWQRFQKDQIDAIRVHSPGRFVTHNFMTNFSDLCPWTLSADLDVAGFDHYQMEAVPHPLTSHHDFALMASLRRRRFWVLEQQPLQVNWQPTNRRFPYPWLFLWGLQSSFLGARGMLYFSWQRMYGGAEQYHDGVVPHDLRAAESPQEKILRAKNEWFRGLATRFGLEELPGQENDVLCIHSSESLWSHEITAQSVEYTTRRQLDWVSAFCTRLGLGLHFAPSIESAREMLPRYRVAILPGYAFELTILEREALRRFVDSGGVVLSLPRTAMKQKNNQMSPLPLCLFDEADFHFEDYGALLAGERERFAPVAPALHEPRGKGRQTARTKASTHSATKANADAPAGRTASVSFQGALWAEHIAVRNSAWETLCRFEGGLYDGAPALLRNARFFHGGAWLHLATCPLVDGAFFRYLARAMGVAPRVGDPLAHEEPFLAGPVCDPAAGPQGAVQVVPLRRGSRTFLGLVNFTEGPATVTLSGEARVRACLFGSLDADLRLTARYWDRRATSREVSTVRVDARGVALVETLEGTRVDEGARPLR